MAKTRKYRPSKQTVVIPATDQRLNHKPMNDESVLDHLAVIKVAMAFPDTVMTAGQIKELVLLDDDRDRPSLAINQSLHHICKIGIREDGMPFHGHTSRLDDYEDFAQFLAMGVFYRTKHGTFVLDTAATWQGEWHRNAQGIRVRRLRLVNNQWPHLPYKGGSRLIPAKKPTPADLPAPEVVVEETLKEIDAPKQYDVTMTVTPDSEERTAPVETDPPLVEDDMPPFEVLPGEMSNGHRDPEPEATQVSLFEMLSVPDALVNGSEMVLRVGTDIVIASVLRRYPLAGGR